MEKKIAFKVSLNTVLGNVILSISKFVAGLLSGSTALVSDAVHSLSDVISTFIVIIGIGISRQKPDKEHLYGHERFECIASVILAVILFMTGFSIGESAVKNIAGNTPKLIEHEYIAAFTALASILIKEFMFRYTKKAALSINSTALMADAHHHRSDALSSIGSLFGIVGVKLGFPLCDDIASLVICGFIIKTSYDIFREAVDQIVDKSCDDNTIDKMKTIISSTAGVMAIDEIKTRLFGNKMYVDLEIAVNADMPLKDAHEIAENVHDKVEDAFPNVKHCMVHVNPYNSL